MFSLNLSLRLNLNFPSDGHVRWVYENAYLEVSCPATNGILASWRFGKELQDKETCVTAVTDVYTQAGLLLIVATSNISDCGTLHVFSVKLRRVVHVIEIPNRVSYLNFFLHSLSFISFKVYYFFSLVPTKTFLLLWKTAGFCF